MRTITTTKTVYLFNELSDDAKEKARDWYRESSAGDEFWSESVLDEYVPRAARFLGIALGRPRNNAGRPTIYYSGFWSQGDGASFAGSWRASAVNVAGLKAEMPCEWPAPEGATNKTSEGRKLAREHSASIRHASELHRIADELARIAKDYPSAYANVTVTGRYSHSGTMRFDCDPGELPDSIADMDDSTDEGDEERDAAADRWREDFPEDDLTQALRDFADWIYSSLEREYIYANSDEAIDENMIANEYEFDEEGNRE